MELVKCKACGYIMCKDKLGEVCPACAVSRKVFEPYTEKVSPHRKKILDLFLHPIAVHFPQAFAIMIPPFLIVSLFIIPPYNHDLFVAGKTLSYFLPFVTVFAFCLGLLDGRIRFKKLNTPALIQKMVVGGCFLALSIAIGIIAFRTSLMGPWRYVVIGLTLFCAGCAAVLGQIGGKLIYAKLPN